MRTPLLPSEGPILSLTCYRTLPRALMPLYTKTTKVSTPMLIVQRIDVVYNEKYHHKNSSMNPLDLHNQAANLRSQGKTFRQISHQMGLPLSTTHLWTKHIQLSTTQLKTIQRNHQHSFRRGQILAIKKQRQYRQQEKTKYLQQGQALIGKPTQRELLFIGASLYWAEGFKKDSRLGFANSDPQMIKLFLKWLLDIFKVPKKDIRLRVGLNQQYIDKAFSITAKWSKMTKIPLSQFQKPFFQKVKWQKTYLKPGNYLGVLRVRANQQTPLFLKIQGMIEGLKTI